MTREELVNHMVRRPRACREAREWVEATPGTPAELWAACPRGDWMLWMAARSRVDRHTVVLAACDCAEAASPYLSDSTRAHAHAAIETARRWTRGEATMAQVRAAADAADAAEASAAYAGYAADAAAHATYAAATAAYAASADAYAASADAAAYAGYAADAAASDAAAAAQQRSADIVRARISWADVEAAITNEARRDAHR